MYGSPLALVLARLDERDCDPRGSGEQFSARCPAHDDRSPSLSVGYHGSRVLLCCHAGCAVEDIVRALDLSFHDLRYESPQPISSNAGPQTTVWSDVASYVYHDANGDALYRIRRLERICDGRREKRFVQGRRLGDGTYKESAGCMKGVRLVPYRLPEMLAAPESDPIWIVEGEKCVHAALQLGLVATTAVGGANQRWDESYAEYFRGRNVAIIPDNDRPGRAHAYKIARALQVSAKDARIVDLPGVPSGGDLVEYVQAGGTRESLTALYDGAPPFHEWSLEQEEDAQNASPVLTVVRLDTVEPQVVRWLWDGRIAYGKVTILDGNPGLGKSHLTIELAACITTGRSLPSASATEPGNAVFVALEDDAADTMRPRAEAAGANLERFYIVKGVPTGDGVDRPLSLPDDVAHLRALVQEKEARLVVIDPITTHLGDRVEVNKDHSIRRALQPLATMAQETGCAVVIVRHLKKNHNGNALAAGGGSMGIIGIARGGLLVTEHPDDPTMRVMVVSKSNLAKFPPALVFSIESGERGSRIEWIEEASFTADELLAASLSSSPADGGALGEAASWLMTQLENGPQPKAVLLKQAKAEGISPRTLERAKNRIGALHERRAGSYYWLVRNRADDEPRRDDPAPTGLYSPSSPALVGNGEDGEQPNVGEHSQNSSHATMKA